MIDVQGTSLNQEDKELLNHPLVGGLILFTRNFENKAQLVSLVSDIKSASGNDILIAVDHEGGRVQRFRDGFSKIPAMGNLLEFANNDLGMAKTLAYQSAQLMALEVMATGIDISFAPVLDVNGCSDVIGNRSFHKTPNLVEQLGSVFIDGLHSVGMKSTGKHFPGHGSVKEDSHVALPVDKRSKEDIFSHDLLPFKALIAEGKIDALMPAHVIYPSIDKEAVGFSSVWLKEILRGELGFNGCIFSDDLSMHGASVVGGFIERAEAAQQAGCDMLLVCNDRDAQIQVIDKANLVLNATSSARIKNMLSTNDVNWNSIQANEAWQQASKKLASL